jgi:hypothetical protein
VNMDKINAYYTQAIVGKPMRLTLGMEIELASEPMLISGTPNAWLSGPLAWGARARQVQWPLMGMLAAAAIGISAFLLLPPVRHDEPIAQVAAPAKPASAPSVAPQALPIMSATAAASAAQTTEVQPPPVSITISTTVFASETVAKPAPIPAPLVQLRLQRPPAKAAPPGAPPVDKGERQPSIIVDSAPAKPAAPPQTQQANRVAASPTPASPANAAAKLPPAKLVSPTVESAATEPSRPAEGAPVTVVDIDKGGAYALITNPKTRLPQKVEVGQTIFTGETIRRIDPAAGRIYLDGGRILRMQ